MNELVLGLGLSQPGVSKHLRVLREAGLVRVRVDGQRRLYALRPQPLTELHEWLEPYRQALGRSSRRPRAAPGQLQGGAPCLTTTPSPTGPWRRALTVPPRSTSSAASPTRSSGSGRRSPTQPSSARWWGDADLDLTDGGRFTLRWLNTDDHGNAATLDGTISKLDPPRLLEITATWGSTATDAPATQTTITWELDPDGDHTLLHFTNTIPGSPAHAAPPTPAPPTPPPPPAGTCTSTPSPPSSPATRSTSPTRSRCSSRSTRPTPRSTVPGPSEYEPGRGSHHLLGKGRDVTAIG